MMTTSRHEPKGERGPLIKPKGERPKASGDRDKPQSRQGQLQTLEDDMKVIPHPTQRGCWTIAITDESGTAIYGSYDRRELAIAVMLTY